MKQLFTEKELEKLIGRSVAIVYDEPDLIKSLCEVLAPRVSKLALITPARLSQPAIVEQHTEDGRSVCSVMADLFSRDEVSNLAARLMRELGSLDLLINISSHVRSETDSGDQNVSFTVAIFRSFEIAQAFGRLMAKQGSGHVIQVVYPEPLMSFRDTAKYSITEAAIAGMAQAFADLWRTSNVQSSFVSYALPPHVYRIDQNVSGTGPWALTDSDRDEVVLKTIRRAVAHPPDFTTAISMPPHCST